MASCSDPPKKQSAKKSASEIQTLIVHLSSDEFLTLSDDTKHWIKDSIPRMLHYRGQAFAIAYLPGLNAIIVAGGGISRLDQASSVEMFDFTTMTWSDQPPMSIERRNTVGLCLPDGITFLVCGGMFDHQFLSSCEQFNSQTRTWSSAADMLTPREAHVMVLYRGIPVVLGGRVEYALNTCEQYNITTNTWLPFPPLNLPREFHGAAVVLDKIYVTGGRNSCTSCLFPHATVEVYDGTSWATLSSLIPSVHRHGHVAVCLQDKLVVLGGYEHKVDVYDPIDNTWLDSYYPPIDSFYFCRAIVF